MKKIILVMVALVPICYSAYLFLTIPDKDTVEELTKKEGVLVSQGYGTVSSYIPSAQPNNSSLSESKMEIEISPSEVLKADTQGLIGTNNPFNPRFITEQDVKASIERILETDGYDKGLFDAEYLPNVISLRHLEMVDSVKESDSKVLSVAKEYKEKLLSQKN